MQRNERTNNKRDEPRINCCGERVAWRCVSERRRRRGWLNDVSCEGLSFLVETLRSPAEGEAVEVAASSGSEPGVYRVMRVTPENDGELALVACRKDAGLESETPDPAPIHIRRPAPIATPTRAAA